MKKRIALFAAVAVAATLVVATASALPPPGKVSCTKAVGSGGVIDVTCHGSGTVAKATARIKPGQAIYAHWAAKPRAFSCLAGFGVRGPYTTGTLSC